MSRPARWILVAFIVLLSWMTLSGWAESSTSERVFAAAFAGFMLTIAFGLAAPRHSVVAFRVVAGVVAVGFIAYFGSELVALLRGARQPIAVGRPSALMAGLGLLVWGVPALVFAVGGVPVGIARLVMPRTSEKDERPV